jgi:hypothetical protein
VKRLSIATGLAALLSLGCSDRIPLGVEPAFWLADHETGDFSQWKEGGDGDTYTSSNANLFVVETPVHSGRYAVRSSIENTSNQSLARLFRQGNLPKEAYYSIWLYLPKLYGVGQYWNVFEFKARREPNNPTTEVYLWSLDLRQESNDRLVWYVYDQIGKQELDSAVPVVAALGRWTRVTAYVRRATDKTGQVTFWIDDQLLVSQEIPPVPSDWMCWSVGSVAAGMPQPSDLFLDDAMISLQPPGG